MRIKSTLTVVIPFLLFLLFLSSSGSHKLPGNIASLQISRHVLFIDPEGVKVPFNADIEFYKKGDLVVYDLKAQFDSFDSRDSVVFTEIRSRYFIFHKDSSFGILYYPPYDEVSRYRVDSFPKEFD